MVDRVSRRGVLRAGIALAATGGIASTASADHPDAQLENTTIEFDEATLEEYRPKLVTRHLEFTPNALFGLVARNPDFDTDVAVFWADYDAQTGVVPLSGGAFDDGHAGDHEPVYVAFNSETGDISGVAYSAYHWMRAWQSGDSLDEFLVDDRHVKLHVVKPWHQYRLTDEEGEDVELKDLTSAFDSWRANGLEEHLQPGTVLNPWIMTGAGGRSHWWRDDVGGWSSDAAMVRMLWRVSQLPGIDFGGAAESEEVLG